MERNEVTIKFTTEGDPCELTQESYADWFVKFLTKVFDLYTRVTHMTIEVIDSKREEI